MARLERLKSTDAKKAAARSAGPALRSAADSIGRDDFDVTKYESNLEKDWYSEEEQLRPLSVDVLSHYMPRYLAEEVRKTLEKSTSHVTAQIGQRVGPALGETKSRETGHSSFLRPFFQRDKAWESLRNRAEARAGRPLSPRISGTTRRFEQSGQMPHIST